MFTSGIINVRITLLDTLESINVEFVHFDEYKNIFYFLSLIMTLYFIIK